MRFQYHKIKLSYFIYIHLNESDLMTANQLNGIWTHDKWTNPVKFSSFTFVCVCLTPTPAACRPPQRHYHPIGHHTLCPTVLHDTPLLCPHTLMAHQRDALGQTLKLHTHTTSSYFLFTWEYICHYVCVYAKTLWVYTYPPLACKRRQPPDG